MKQSITLPNEVAVLLSKYSSLLTQGSSKKTIGAKSGLLISSSPSFRFMEKILLTDCSPKKARKRRRVILPEPSLTIENAKSQLSGLKNNLNSPSQSPLVLPQIAVFKPKEPRKNRNRSNDKEEDKRQISSKSSTRVISNKKTSSQSIISVGRPEPKRSSNELITVDKMHLMMTRKKEKLNTISFNPYLESLHDAHKEDKELSLITDFIFSSSMPPSVNAKPSTYMLRFDKVLNVKSFSIHGLFEGKGAEASYLSSYSKNLFASLVTQSLTYDFKSSLINSKTVYQAIAKKDHEVLKELWERVKELLSIARCHLSEGQLSFSLLFLIGRRAIAMSYGTTRTIALENRIDKDIEHFASIPLSDAKGNELCISEYNLNEDTINIVIGTSGLWEDARPYYNVIRVLSLTKLDIKAKADLLSHCKKKLALHHKRKEEFAFIILNFVEFSRNNE